MWVLLGWSCGCGRVLLGPGQSLGFQGAPQRVHHISRKAQHKLALGQHFQAIDPHSSHLLPVPIVSDAWAKGEGVLHLLGVWPECKWSPGHQRLQDGGNHRHQHHLSSFAVLVAHCEEQRGSLRVATFNVCCWVTNSHTCKTRKNEILRGIAGMAAQMFTMLKSFCPPGLQAYWGLESSSNPLTSGKVQFLVVVRLMSHCLPNCQQGSRYSS